MSRVFVEDLTNIAKHLNLCYWILCETVLPGQGDVPSLTEVDFTDTDQTKIVFKYICSLELLLHTMWVSGIQFPLFLVREVPGSNPIGDIAFFGKKICSAEVKCW
jgi:hypothetical protein